MKTSRLVFAIGPSADLFAKPLFGVLDVVVDGRLDDLETPTCAITASSSFDAMLHGADHGGEITRESREAIVALDQLDDVASLLAAMHELQARDRQPFGENIRGLQGEAARVLAARIALVRLQRLNQDELARIVEHRGVDVVIGQMAAAIIRIVSEEHIARAPVVVLRSSTGP